MAINNNNIDPTRKTSGIPAPNTSNGANKSSGPNPGLSARFAGMQRQSASMRSNSDASGGGMVGITPPGVKVNPTNTPLVGIIQPNVQVNSGAQRTSGGSTESSASLEQEYSKLENDYANFSTEAAEAGAEAEGIAGQIENLKFVSASYDSMNSAGGSAAAAGENKESNKGKKEEIENQIKELQAKITTLKQKAGEAAAKADNAKVAMEPLPAKIEAARQVEDKQFEMNTVQDTKAQNEADKMRKQAEESDKAVESKSREAQRIRQEADKLEKMPNEPFMVGSETLFPDNKKAAQNNRNYAERLEEESKAAKKAADDLRKKANELDPRVKANYNKPVGVTPNAAGGAGSNTSGRIAPPAPRGAFVIDASGGSGVNGIGGNGSGVKENEVKQSAEQEAEARKAQDQEVQEQRRAQQKEAKAQNRAAQEKEDAKYGSAAQEKKYTDLQTTYAQNNIVAGGSEGRIEGLKDEIEGLKSKVNELQGAAQVDSFNSNQTDGEKKDSQKDVESLLSEIIRKSADLVKEQKQAAGAKVGVEVSKELMESTSSKKEEAKAREEKRAEFKHSVTGEGLQEGMAGIRKELDKLVSRLNQTSDSKMRIEIEDKIDALMEKQTRISELRRSV